LVGIVFARHGFMDAVPAKNLLHGKKKPAIR
jgi:hypothetical protein